MATPNISQKAFESAKHSFKKDLNNDSLYEDILRTDSIDKLFEAIERLQRTQDAERRVRRLSKMKNILEKLQGFHSAVDTYTQVKPEIMALIWGSIRVLLVLTDNVAKFADAVITAMEDISDALPFFTDVAKIFDDNEKLRDKLALFYGDILQFYVIAFNFFNMSRPKLMFEAMWPKQKAKIALLVTHIERHTSSMRNEMTFHHIREEHELRVKALAHLDQETEFQDQQKFHALRSRVTPQSHNDRLDWLLNRLSNGSVNWLRSDSTFLSWLEISNSATQLLWLQGIPGAGKTYLAAAAIKEAEARHQTLFAFPSHIYRSSTTAKSILQSLLFQLASHVKDIRAVLVESDERDLTGSTSKVSEIFKTVLKTAGPTYIILDGLDEMDGDERRMLLEQLCRLKECVEAKIMVSSRAEDDIGKLLSSKAASIVVHKNNSASIQSYVNQRIQDWLDNADFVQHARKKIWHMLAPLAANAEGMFLYARIVLDNVELLNNLNEIEQELTVLPKNLNDVYYRIFARIQGLPPALHRKAKRIFNWIACAPAPMTQHEMEQMLDIDSTKDAAPSTMNSINFVGICGAAVEVVDETPRFVHFTVSEYIFSQQVADFGNKAEANLSLANSTLKYLCSGIFDEGISDKQIKQYILAGKYRLHWFAFTQWISLITSCLEHSSDLAAYPDLLETLCRLALELRNYRFEGAISLKVPSFQRLESEWPEIIHIVCGVLQFRQNDEQADWNYENHHHWTDKDPSIMSLMWARIYKQFTAILCGRGYHRQPVCDCETMKRNYGSRIHKCWYPSCSSSRGGFATDESRDLHIKRDNHGRPWKCRKEGCEFGTIGFSTQRDADNHWRNRHRVSNQGTTRPSWVRQRDELQVLLFELTKAGDFEALQNLLANVVPPDSYAVREIPGPAILLAAAKGSLPTVEILMDWSDCWTTDWHDERTIYPDKKEFYRAIFKGNSPDLLIWFLEKLLFEKCEFYRSGWLAGEAVATGSPDMYAAWEDFFLDRNRGLIVGYPCYTGDPDALWNEALTSGKWSDNRTRSWPRRYERKTIQDHYRRSVLFSRSAFSAAKKNALCEARLIQTWHKLIHNVLGGQTLDRRYLGCALVSLAQTSNPSISLAAELVRLGAPIDFPRGAGSSLSTAEAEKIVQVEPELELGPGGRRETRQKTQKGMTALHYAARQTSEQASHFIRFLLEQGADPEYAYAHKRPATEPGVVLMKKWLGETWDEVVERTKGARMEKERLNKLKYCDSIVDSEGEDADEIGSDSEEDDYEVEESEVDPAEARRTASEQRAERAAKRRRLD